MRARRVLRRCSLVVLAGLISSAPASAKPTGVFPDEARLSTEPLPMVVHLSQQELLTGRDPGDTYEVGGGLVGAAIQSLLSDGANDALDPSRNALARAEAEETLMAAIRESVAPIPWISLADGSALLDNSLNAKSALLDQSSASRLLDADCSYSISQRFQAVYAFCSLQVASKEGDSDPEERWEGRNLVYSTYVEAQVELANIAQSVGGRREQWVANSGALLRDGLRHALTKVGMLVGLRLQMTTADFEAAAQNEKFRLVTAYVGMAGEHKGRVLQGQDNILRKFSPNTGGRSYLYKPGRDGVVFVEDRGGLFYHWTIEAPPI